MSSDLRSIAWQKGGGNRVYNKGTPSPAQNGGKGDWSKRKRQPSNPRYLRGRVIWLETWHISTEWKIMIPLPKLLAKGNWQGWGWRAVPLSPPPALFLLPFLAVCEEQSRWLPVADFSWQHAIRNCRPVDQSSRHDRFAARPGSLSASAVAFSSFFPALIGESFFTVLVAEEILLNVVTIKCWLL